MSSVAHFIENNSPCSANQLLRITLGHANKHRDEHTGKPVFEGTGDVMNDVDCMYMMYPITVKTESSQTVKMEVLKERSGQVDELMFTYNQPQKKLGHYREMLDSLYFLTSDEKSSTIKKERVELLRQRFSEQIIFLRGILKKGMEIKQGEIVKLHHEDKDNWGFKRDPLIKALHLLIDIEWTARRGAQNALLFKILPGMGGGA